MPTSGTYNWKLDVDTLLRRAFDKVGGSKNTTEELRAGLDALNLVVKDISNKGVVLSNMALTTVAAVSGQASYALDSSVVDVLSGVVARDTSEFAMLRTPVLDYHKITNKTVAGRPSQFAVDRDRDNVNFYAYPVPENSTDKFIFWSVLKTQDISALNQDIDMSSRFMGPLVFGTAYYLSFDRPKVSLERRQDLKREYMDQLDAAFSEDRTRASFFVRGYRRRR